MLKYENILNDILMKYTIIEILVVFFSILFIILTIFFKTFNRIKYITILQVIVSIVLSINFFCIREKIVSDIKFSSYTTLDNCTLLVYDYGSVDGGETGFTIFSSGYAYAIYGDERVELDGVEYISLPYDDSKSNHSEYLGTVTFSNSSKIIVDFNGNFVSNSDMMGLSSSSSIDTKDQLYKVLTTICLFPIAFIIFLYLIQKDKIFKEKYDKKLKFLSYWCWIYPVYLLLFSVFTSIGVSQFELKKEMLTIVLIQLISCAFLLLFVLCFVKGLNESKKKRKSNYKTDIINIKRQTILFYVYSFLIMLLIITIVTQGKKV